MTSMSHDRGDFAGRMVYSAQCGRESGQIPKSSRDDEHYFPRSFCRLFPASSANLAKAAQQRRQPALFIERPVQQRARP